MSKLTLIQNNDGLEFHIDEETNIAYASVRATARMCGKPQSTIQSYVDRAFGGERGSDLLKAEIQTTSGVQGASLLTAEQVFEAALKYSPELAKKMGACGANVFMLGLAGYEVQAAIPATPKTPLELAKEQVRLHEALELQAMQIKLLEEDNLRQSEAIDELFEYSSIIRIAKFNNVGEKSFAWHKLKAASMAIDEEIKKVPCPRFGTKNLYSHNAWRVAYPWAKLPETTTLVIQN
jgi:hypothetical protein